MNISLSMRVPVPLTDVVNRREYDKLENYLAYVTEQLNHERQKVAELSKIRNRLSLEGAGLVVAYIIPAASSGLRKELLINRGRGDGLAKDQFVLGDNNSIIGRVAEVSSRTSRVRLITDPMSKIAVIIASKLLQ